MSNEITVDELAAMIKGEFDRVHEQMGVGFRSVNGRIDSLETKVDSLESRFDVLETKVDSLDTQVKDLDCKVTRIDDRTQNQVDGNYQHTSAVEKRVVRIEKHLGLKPLSSARA